MTGANLPDAQVSNDGLELMARNYDEAGAPETAAALRELKALRERCDRQREAQMRVDGASEDQLMRIGRALEYLFPELPEIPMNVWHRFSFDVVQDAGGVSVAHIRFAPIGQPDSAAKEQPNGN